MRLQLLSRHRTPARCDRSGRYLCTPGFDVQRSFMLYAVVGTVVALLRSDLLHDIRQQHHRHLLPFDICLPSSPVSEGGAGQGEGAYGVTQRVPPDAQVHRSTSPRVFNSHKSLIINRASHI